MAGNTDERIIQMKFENRQFERNIAQSKKSLEDFKKEMKFEDTSRDLENFAKTTNKLDFSNLLNNVQKLTDRFTGLGDAGDYILRRIRAGFESVAASAEHFIKSLSIDQIVVGQGKYDALNKAVMTITATGEYTEEKAYEVFDRLMTYTNQTSYSFSDMVNQIASFTSTGVKLDSAEAAMEGIANLSAKAGQGVSQASNAMSIFSKALGQGFLGLNQWQSLNLSAHIITKEFRQVLADTAVEMGTLKKEGDKYYTNTKKGKKTLVEVSNLENTLNQQWATSAVLLKTLQKYYFHDIDNPDSPAWDTEFAGSAAKAAQRALSFTDAINAMKETVSAGWLESYRIIFGDLSEAMEFFTNVADRAWETLTKIKDFRNEILRDWASNGGRKSLIEILLGDYGKEEDAAKGAYGIIDMIDDVGKLLYEGFVDFVGIFAGADDRAMFKDPEEGVTYFREWLGIQLAKITANVEKFLQGIRDWFNETIDVGGESKTRLELLHEIIMGIVAVLALGIQVVMGIGSFLLAIAGQLQPSFDKIEEFLGTLGLTLYDSTAAATEAKTIPQFFHDLAEECRPLTDGINEVVGTLMDLFNMLLDNDKKQGNTKSFFQTIGDGLKTIAKILGTVGRPIFKFIKDIIDAFGIILTEGINGQSLTKFGQKIGAAIGDLMRGIADALPESLGFLKEWIRNLFGQGEQEVKDGTNSLFGMIGASMTDAEKKAEKTGNAVDTSAIGVLTSGSNLLTWIGVIGGVGASGLILMAIKFIRDLGWFFDELASSLKKGFRVQYDNNADYFYKIVKGIVLLVASVVILGMMPVDSLIKGVIALTVIMGIIFVMFKLLKNNTSAGKVSEQLALAGQMAAIAASIMLLGIAVGIIALALIPFALMKPEQLINAISGLSWVLIEIVAFMAITKKLKVSTKNLAGFVGFAFSIGILIFALKPFANMNITQYIQSISGLAWVMLELIAFMKIIDKLKLDTGKLAGFIGFAFSIGILIFALKPFANMDISQYMQAISGLAWVLLELIAAMYLIKRNDLGGVKLAGFIGFAISIGILILAIRPLATMDPFQYVKAVLGIGFVLLELIAAMYLIKNNDLGGVKLAGFIGFAVSIAILIMAVQPLADMEPAKYVKAILGIAFIIAELIAAMYIIKSVNVEGVKLAGFIGFAVSIFILIKAIEPLANMTTDQYIKAISGIAWIMLELIAFMVIIKKLDVKSVQVAGLMGFVAALSTLVNSFQVFKGMNIGEIMGGLAGIGGVLLMLAMFMEATKKIKFNMKNMLAIAVAVGALSALMLVFSLSLSIVKDMDWGLVAAFAGGLSVLLLALAGAIVILSGVPLVTGLKAIALIGAALTAILGVVALMAPILLGSLGSSLSNMSGKLAIMADMFSIFSTRMAGADENGMTKAKKMIDDLYDLLGDMNKFGTMKMSSSATSSILFSLGTGLDSFAFHAKSATEATAGLQFIKDLAACATDLDTISRMNLTNLSSNIAGLGGAMMLYAKGAVEASGEGIKEDIDLGGAVQLMNKISEALVEKGGFTIPPNMPQPEDIGNFGAQLAALAGALVMIEEAGRGFGTGTENTIRALQFFQNLKVELEKQAFLDGIAAIFGFNSEFARTGMTTSEMTKFGGYIQELGSALKAFADSTTTVDAATGEIKPTSYEAAIESLNRFADLEERLPKLKGIVHWWSGQQQTLSDLGNDVQQLGSGLMTFSNKITGQGIEGQEGIAFDATAAGAALDTMDKMVTFIQDVNTKLPRLGGIKNFFTTLWNGEEYSFKEFGDQVGQMGDGLAKLGEGLNKGGWNKDTGAEYALSALDSILSIIEKMSRVEDAAQITGWSSDKLASLFAGFTADLYNTEGIENTVRLMSKISDEFADWEDIDTSKIQAFNYMANALASLASIDPKYDWKTIGLQIDTGIGDGLIQGMGTVKAAATTVTTAAHDVAVEKASTIVATISQILSDQLVAQPTISPVLDMTDATAKFNQFTSMVGSKPVTIDGTRAALMAGALGNQNGTDLSGVHTRMDKIEASINDLGTAISNMRIVLDTGLMVGALTPGIDGNIGRRQWLAARRNVVNGTKD